MSVDYIRERIRLIGEGLPFTFNDLTIRVDNSGKLLVIGWSKITSFENLSKNIVLKELEDLKIKYFKLADSFEELNDIISINSLKIEYHISFDDAGKCGIELCSEIDGNLYWYI